MKTKHEQLEKSPRKYFLKKFPVFNYQQMSIINVAIERPDSKQDIFSS